MGSVFKRGRVWWLKYKDAAGEWTPEASKAATKPEAKALLHEIERRVERQRLGLEPLSMNPEAWTSRTSCSGGSTRTAATPRRTTGTSARCAGTSSNHRSGRSRSSTFGRATSSSSCRRWKGSCSASTINHIRQFLVGAFNRAREAGKWLGANPAEPVRTRRGPEQVGDILLPEELAPFMAALDPEQRPVFAAAIFTGLRKGELCGLQKMDVDIPRRLLVARRSYARPFPKSRKQRVVRIADEFVPFLEYAIETFPGPWLFPDPDGGMRTVTWQPEDILRRALRRAGIVTGLRTSAGGRPAASARSGPMTISALALAAASSSGRRATSGRSGSTISGTPTRASCSCRVPRSSRCSGYSGTRTRRSPSGATGTSCRTSWQPR